jgi:hypothetical protein
MEWKYGREEIMLAATITPRTQTSIRNRSPLQFGPVSVLPSLIPEINPPREDDN